MHLASPFDELTRVDLALHIWHRTLYVRWSVLSLKGSFGSGLIARYRDSTW